MRSETWFGKDVTAKHQSRTAAPGCVQERRLQAESHPRCAQLFCRHTTGMSGLLWSWLFRPTSCLWVRSARPGFLRAEPVDCSALQFCSSVLSCVRNYFFGAANPGRRQSLSGPLSFTDCSNRPEFVNPVQCRERAFSIRALSPSSEHSQHESLEEFMCLVPGQPMGRPGSCPSINMRCACDGSPVSHGLS